jgi:hypothetical protein
VSQFFFAKDTRVTRGFIALICTASLFSVSAYAQAPAAGNSVKVGKFTKLASGVVTEITNGDAACYISLKDDKGQVFDETGDFSICEKPQSYIGKRVNLTYELGKVMADECGGDPKCKKTTTVALVTALKVVDGKGASAAATSPVAAAAKGQAKNATRTRGHLQYRFGKPNSTEPLELMLPEDFVPANKAATGEFMPFAGGAGAWLRFNKGAFSYVVYSGVGRWGPKGESKEKSGVVVERSGKAVASLKCVGAAQSELGPEWMEKRAITLKPNEEFLFPD